MTARITGIVAEILVDRGSVVVKDQPLARLDARELDAEVVQAQEDMELRRLVFERAKSLSANKVLSAADLDEKKARYQVAAAQLERVRTMRDYTIIRAPFAGAVTEKYARVGQKVIEDRSEPLFKITAFEPLLARVYLPEEELLTVKRGDPVEVLLDRFPKARATRCRPVHQSDGRCRKRDLPGDRARAPRCFRACSEARRRRPAPIPGAQAIVSSHERKSPTLLAGNCATRSIGS